MILTPEEKKRVEALAAEVREVARRHAHRARELGSDLEEAALSAQEYYCDHPHSVHPPAAIFRVCLRRALSKRLRPSLSTNDLPE
jgi:hypothetical protein